MLKLLAVVLAVILLPACSYAHDITIEAETYTNSFDAGGNTIDLVSCTAASGGWAVEGFDWPGDWIELSLTTPELGAYADTLRSAGLYGYESDLRLTIFNGSQGGENLISYYHPVGLGIG